MCWKGQSHLANGVIQMQKCASVTAESFRLRLKCLKKISYRFKNQWNVTRKTWPQCEYFNPRHLTWIKFGLSVLGFDMKVNMIFYNNSYSC